MLNIEIKILGVNELNDFRVIRLSALAKAPEMFGSTYSIEVVKPLSFFERCLSSSTIFGIYHKDRIIGLATLTRETATKLSHKAYLSSVFIEPEFQGLGIANRLLTTVIEHSKQYLEQILLIVADDNQPAIKLYKKFGFQTYGVESKALKNNAEYTDEILMKLFLASNTCLSSV
ncbi:MAG: GNAT family N-acetyltransferase [Acinetobacter sp. 39-4]|nr:MAG: GNAT family N-acetyltransferase [Acinetobacter sp. 39-4]